MEDVKAKSGNGTAIVSAVVLGADIIGLLVLGGLTLSVRGKFAEMFASMKDELPAITKFLFSIPSAAYAGIFLSLILILILKEIFIRARTANLVINLAAGLGGIVYLFIYVIALFLPLIQMMTETSQPVR